MISRKNDGVVERWTLDVWVSVSPDHGPDIGKTERNVDESRIHGLKVRVIIHRNGLWFFNPYITSMFFHTCNLERTLLPRPIKIMRTKEMASICSFLGHITMKSIIPSVFWRHLQSLWPGRRWPVLLIEGAFLRSDLVVPSPFSSSFMVKWSRLVKYSFFFAFFPKNIFFSLFISFL